MPATYEMNEPSILISIKKMLGLPKEYTPFDMDVTVHINTVMSSLKLKGIGPKNGFILENESQTWEQYMVEQDPTDVSNVKTYIYTKVRLLFDPPTNSILAQTLEKNANELEYYLYTVNGGY